MLDLEAFKTNHRYQQTVSPLELIRDLEALKQFDRQQEGKARRWKYVMFGSLVAMVIAFIGYGPLAALVGVHPNFALIFPAAFLALAIFAAIFFWKNRRADLSNEHCEFATAVCEMVRADMASSDTVDVFLDFSSVEQKVLLKNQLQRGYWSCKLYVQPWLRIRGRLIDGTRFDIRATLRCEKRTAWKQSRSGKRKAKRKTKSQEVLNVVLTPKRDSTVNLAAHADRIFAGLRIPKETRVTHRHMDENAVELGIGVPVPVAAPEDALAFMMMSLYEMVSAGQGERKSVST